jgi:signal transduction histidine kinase
VEVSSPRRIVADGGPTATLADVDVLGELEARPARSPDYEAQNLALAALAEEMAVNPRNMLQRLVEVAVDLCQADTSGISLLEGDVFRWEAVAGVFAGARNGTMPRDASPCGVVIDRDAIQLMALPDRCFPALLAEPRFVEALLFPFHAHGKPVGTVWIVSHRPERRFDREDARIVKLLTQFASSAWQLWQRGEEARENSHRKDEFVVTLSHELRNPFGAIVNAASVLQQRIGQSDPARRAVDVIIRQSQLVRRLIDDLLDIGRIEAGKFILNEQTVDLRPIVQECVEMRRPSVVDRQHELHLDLAASPVIARADALRVTQIVANLVDNAARYTPPHGHIRVSVAALDGYAEITVQDNGDGIPPDRLDAIFETFTQLRPVSGGPGLGLGLALVRRLTELQGGSIQVFSEGEGRGSQFTVRLPAAQRVDSSLGA